MTNMLEILELCTQHQVVACITYLMYSSFTNCTFKNSFIGDNIFSSDESVSC